MTGYKMDIKYLIFDHEQVLIFDLQDDQVILENSAFHFSTDFSIGFLSQCTQKLVLTSDSCRASRTASNLVLYNSVGDVSGLVGGPIKLYASLVKVKLFYTA